MSWAGVTVGTGETGVGLGTDVANSAGTAVSVSTGVEASEPPEHATTMAIAVNVNKARKAGVHVPTLKPRFVLLNPSLADMLRGDALGKARGMINEC